MMRLRGLLCGFALVAGLVGTLAASSTSTSADVEHSANLFGDVQFETLEESNGECRSRYILEAFETRVIHCDLSTLLGLGRFSAVVETGNYLVPGFVSDVFRVQPFGAIVVLRNPTPYRQRGTVRIFPIVLAASDSA